MLVRKGAAFARKFSSRSNLLIGTAAAALLALPAHANPLGGTVTTGSAAISSPSKSATTVTQTSEGVVINWSSFDVGSGQTTTFVQPNAQAIAVNRVGSASASQILGTLDANGRVVIINGNGLLFGKNAKVNVGSLIATSTDGSDSDVLAGKFTNAGNQNASIVNRGAITAASRGTVALVAPNVSNSGIVQAKLGTVSLGGANAFTVDFKGDGLVSFAAQGDVNGAASVVNTGKLVGANIAMTAHAAEDFATGVVSTSGTIVAKGAHAVGGTVLLDAGNGWLTTGGRIDAAGKTGGGAIETSGNQVSIRGKIDAGQNGNWKIDPTDLTIDSNAATSIDNALNGGTSVTEQTTSSPAGTYGNQTSGNGDINVDSALSWSTNALLTLDAYHSIYFDAPVTISGGGGLTLKTDDGGTGGNYYFEGGSVAYTDIVSGTPQGALTINNVGFTLLGTMASMQAINTSSTTLSGDYALADPLNASTTTGWVALGVNSSGAIQNSSKGFKGIFEGLGNTISNLTVTGGTLTGVFGYSSGTIRDIGIVAGSITGGNFNGNTGGLVGYNAGTIFGSYFAGSVTANDADGNAGGLAGYNAGTISNSSVSVTLDGTGAGMGLGGLVGEMLGGSVTASYAAGTVKQSSSSDSSTLGGLVGINDSSSSISESYSTAYVAASSGGGGLVGVNISGQISDSYATGAVTGSNAGGLVGEYISGTLSDNFWDMQTTGVASTRGAGNSTSVSGITGDTTAQLQAALPGSFSSSIWGNVAGVSYPYLLWQVPSGTPQVLSGIEYADSGTTVKSGDAVAALANGSTLASAITGGSVTTGANGYYYFLLEPGTIATDSAIVAYTANAARVETISGSASGFDILGNTLIAPTSDTTYSSANATTLQTQDSTLISSAVGSNSALASEITGLTNYGYVATGASFTLDTPLTLSHGLYVETTAGNAGITVAGALALPSANTLELNAAGALAIGAPIGVTGAGSVALDYSAAAATNFSFELGSSGFAGDISYGTTNNGGALSINGNVYTLLYSLSNVQTIAGSGNYALANSINLSGNSSFTPVGESTAFTGTFDGLGNTISNLAYSSSATYAGLFGQIGAGGTVANIGLVGGQVTDNVTSSQVGGLAGYNAGTIFDAFATGSVTDSGSGSFLGGLVGKNNGTITGAYTTGAVAGINDVGGVAGETMGTISDSYSTASVTVPAGSSSAYAGGLVGYFEGSTGGAIENSYAMGAVSAGAGTGNHLGGLVGAAFDGEISTSYATGFVNGASGSTVGGLVGEDSQQNYSDDYWDTNTSGIANTSQGSGSTANEPGITGMTTTNLQAALPTGFLSSSWGIVAGESYPYLCFQIANCTGTPQVVSGFVTNAGTAQAAIGIGLLVNGTAASPAVATTSSANGYYYLLLEPGTISASNNVLAYLASGSVKSGNSVYEDAQGSITGLNIEENVLQITTGATTASAAMAGLNSAVGSQTFPALLYTQAGGFVSGGDVFFTGTGASFDIDTTLNAASNYLKITANGPLTESAGIIDANELFLCIDGSITLGGANDFTTLKATTTGATGNIDINDTAAMAVDGHIDAGYGAGDLTLTSGGAITQSATSVMDAGTFGGNSAGTATFNGANVIKSLGSFTNTGSSDFYLTDTRNLSLTGTLSVGYQAGLTSSGTISETGAGIIDTTSLVGNSVGGTTLDNAGNDVAEIDAFTNSGTGGFSFDNSVRMTIKGPVAGGAGDVDITALTGNLVSTANISGADVTLSSTTGNFTQNSGSITTAGVLTVNAQRNITMDNLNTYSSESLNAKTGTVTGN